MIEPSPTTADLSGAGVHELLAGLRVQRPVAWIPAIQGWLVTRWDLAVQVMRDAPTFTVDDSRFSTARVVGPSMLSLDGAEHRRHRTPFVEPFRRSRVNDRFAAEVESVTHGLLDRHRSHGRADLRPTLAGPLSVLVVASALGLHDVDAEVVLEWYSHIVDAVSTSASDVPVPATAVEAMDSLAQHVRSGLADGGHSVLRDATGSLDDGDVVANAAVMMFGGIETTEGMITNAILHLLEHPDVLREVRDNASLDAAAVEESLRLEPAAAAVDRYATRAVALGGADIARGDFVRVSLSGANRDPAVFDHPDEYDIHRDNLRSQLSFAQGPHVCIAMDLARLEAQVAVRAVLQTLPELRLDEPVAPTGLVFRKPAHLRVSWSTG